MKKSILSMSLLIALSIGSLAQAQGLGGSLRGQLRQNNIPQLNDQRLQQIQDLESQVQDGGNQTRSLVVQDGGVGPQDGQLEGGSGGPVGPQPGNGGGGGPIGPQGGLGGGGPVGPQPGIGDGGGSIGPQDGFPGDGFGGGEIPGNGFGGGEIPENLNLDQGGLQPTGQIPTAQIQEGGVQSNALIQDGGIEGAAAPGPGGVIVEEKIQIPGNGPVQIETGLNVATQELSIGALVESIPNVGMRVLKVAYGSKAQLIGLEPGDLIRSINRIPISSAPQFEALLQQAIELQLGQLNILVRNANYGDAYGVQEFSILQLRLVYARPVIIENYDEHYGDHDHYEHYQRPIVHEYVRPYHNTYRGGCHK